VPERFEMKWKVHTYNAKIHEQWKG